jgi:hypothetical protein
MTHTPAILTKKTAICSNIAVGRSYQDYALIQDAEMLNVARLRMLVFMDSASPTGR